MKQRLQKRPKSELSFMGGFYRFNNSPLSMQVSRCVYSTQDFKRMVKQ